MKLGKMNINHSTEERKTEDRRLCISHYIGVARFVRKKNYCKVRKVKCVVSHDPGVKYHLGMAKVKCYPSKTVKCSVSYSGYILKSQCYHGVDIGTENINCARSIVVKLLLSGFNTSDGITLSADMPFSKKSLMNISRPAVLRTYYGLDSQCISPSHVKRATYGPTSLTGPLSMDPRVYSTKPMSIAMYELGVSLKKFVKLQLSKDSGLKSDKIFDCEFNHCTVLTYNAHIPNINNKLSYHCDCQYDRHGKFMESQNSQGQNTPVIIYSLGDSRTLSFRQRSVTNGKKSFLRWKTEKVPCQKFELTDNSIFVLHPMDEKPTHRPPSQSLSQFQHGNVDVKDGNMSIALVYRNVTRTLVYDNVTLTRVLNSKDPCAKAYVIDGYDASYQKYASSESYIGMSFKKNAEQKFRQWNWIK